MSLTVVPPPTPNGGLHLGHLSGPYLYADVNRRWKRQQGETSGLWVHTDNNQVYCVTAADNAGEALETFVPKKAARIRSDFEAASLSFDGFCAAPPAEYASFVNDFFSRVREHEHVVTRQRTFFVDSQRGEPLADALISGRCRHCLSGSSGGICELCGTPNDPTELLEPRHATKDVALETKLFEVVEIDLQHFAPALRNRFAASNLVVRPRLRGLLDRLLSAPLPSVPLTLPGDWGCPVAAREGQVFNPWAELLPGAIFHSQALDGSGRWSSKTGPHLFFGFDNSFFYTLLHSALQIASGTEYALPVAYTTNEFYELDHKKFSSGQNHAVWMQEGVDMFGVDALRFHVCATNPMYQRANFSADEAKRNIDAKLLGPLRALLEARAALRTSEGAVEVGTPLPLEDFEREATTHYASNVLDLNAMAHRLSSLLSMLASEATEAAGAARSEHLGALDAGLALWAQLALPLMPTLAGRLKDALLGPGQRDTFIPYKDLAGGTSNPSLDFDSLCEGSCKA